MELADQVEVAGNVVLTAAIAEDDARRHVDAPQHQRQRPGEQFAMSTSRHGDELVERVDSRRRRRRVERVLEPTGVAEKRLERLRAAIDIVGRDAHHDLGGNRLQTGQRIALPEAARQAEQRTERRRIEQLGQILHLRNQVGLPMMPERRRQHFVGITPRPIRLSPI